ncbi:transposase [Peribacillus loiseleuriae]|uniref:transposase n=1 Tax=Peribacillus loiseleuriae TaxID=1679170 RepID=UPI003D01D325
MRVTLQETYRYSASIAELALQDWIEWGVRCSLEPMKDVAKMIKAHYSGII